MSISLLQTTQWVWHGFASRCSYFVFTKNIKLLSQNQITVLAF
jgi:hypothetical protein